jgi:hypothetical protein
MASWRAGIAVVYPYHSTGDAGAYVRRGGAHC